MKRIPLYDNALDKFTGTPSASYAEGHKVYAEKVLAEYEQRGMTIHKKWTDGDGWMDGHMTTWAIVELGGKLQKIHWHDGNMEFFVSLGSGGSVPFRD